VVQVIFDNQGVVIPDISFWQDDDTTPQGVDFARMKSAGAAGVIIRAGQNNWGDEDFKANWSAAKEAGLPRGAYWFFDSRAEPGAQATLWRAQIGNDLPELGLWVDLEESYGGTWKGERNWRTFLEAVKIVFPGVLVGIYTATWWWQNQVVTDPEYFARHPLWVAQYVSTHLFVVLPKPWENQQAKFWQYTAKGDGPKYGTESLNVDLNYWNGDMESYWEFFGLDGETEPPGNGGSMSQWYRVDTAKLNIRDGAGIGNIDIGDLFLGDRVEVEGAPVAGWGHIVRVLRVSAGAPVAMDGWCSLAYCVATPPPVVEPPPTEEIIPPDYIVAGWLATATRPAMEKRYIPE